MPGGLGLVHLADLQVSYPWAKPRLPALLEALGWPTEEAAPQTSLDPPPTLAVVVPMHLVSALTRHRAWLRRARALLFIRDISDPGDAELGEDDELRAVLADEYAAAEAALGGPVEALWWTGVAASTAALRRRLEELSAAETWPAEPDDALTPVVASAPALPPGPWLPWQTEPLGGLGALARTICVDDGRPAILDLRRRDPRAPVRQPTTPAELRSLVDGAALRRGAPVDWAAISGDARRVLGWGAEGCGYGSLAGPRAPVAGLERLRPFYVDPRAGVGAAGGRCWFHWLRVTENAVGILAPVVHDWPCGHGKKLWGYMDNEPVRAEVTPRLDAYLSVYDVDAIVGSVVALRWRRAGPVWVPVWPPADPRRALFTCPDWTFLSDGDKAAALDDEDCRGDAPAIALGPDLGHRYALGLDREVWRIRGATVEALGGPDEGYAVFDADHQRRRSGPGRLLCGGGGWLWIADEGVVWREPFAGGERLRCVDVDRRIDAALALPGRANAALIHVVAEDGGDAEEEVRRVPWFHENFEIRVV